MAHKIFSSTVDHSTFVLDCFNLWTDEENYLQIITSDQKKINTQTKLIAFYCLDIA